VDDDGNTLPPYTFTGTPTLTQAHTNEIADNLFIDISKENNEIYLELGTGITGIPSAGSSTAGTFYN